MTANERETEALIEENQALYAITEHLRASLAWLEDGLDTILGDENA